jgi:hypothetical protein
MATHTPGSRLALRPVADRTLPYGAWWPESRQLSEQLAGLLALWPTEEGRVARVLYSPPDWDDHPRSVAVPGRTIKTGSFPHDDTHLLTLSLLDGSRRSIRVIPSDTSASEARGVLDGVTAGSR